MLRKLGTASAIGLIALGLGGTGCGEDSDESKASRPPTGASGASGATGPNGGGQDTEPDQDRQTPVEAVEEFYSHLNARRYSDAWDLVPEQVQDQSGGFDQWRAGYETTVSSVLEGAKVTELAGDLAVVAITLRATDRDACTSDKIQQIFEGSWRLSPAGDGWDADAIQLDKVSGPTPTLSAENCPDAEPPPSPPAPPPNDSCTPGYSPCLAPASDYDCEGGSGDGPSYTGFVEVSGSDPYGLDADGDGLGCET